jgi:uncharacterized membrane protein
MKNLVKKDWIIWLILLIPFAVIAYYWNQFPEQIPSHWNMQGEVNDYSGKFAGLFLMPLVNIGLYILLLALPYIDPKKANYPLFKHQFYTLRVIIHSFLSGIFLTVIFSILNNTLSAPKIIPLAVVFLFLVLGNYLGTIRPNYFIGVRTPWTLANEDVWVKTHRFTGKLWVFTSFIMLIVISLMPMNKLFMIAYIVILTVPSFIYSYLEFKKTEKKQA